MPWKESSVVEERLLFVARVLDGEPLTELCREFGISRSRNQQERYKGGARTASYNRPDRGTLSLPGLTGIPPGNSHRGMRPSLRP